VVEDQEETREVYTACLRAEGWGVEATCDGSEGVQRALALRPDAIVMDLEMPNLDGNGAIRQLRWNADTKAIPIIVVTGHVELCSGPEAKMVDRILKKPCMNHELLDAMRSVLTSAKME